MEKINIITQIRTKFNISQEELAHILNVSYTSVNAWEGGKRKPQEHMLSVLNELLEANEIPSLGLDLKSPKGLQRSDAGYVSSIINYANLHDQYPYTHGIGRWYGSLPSFLVQDILKFIRTDFCNNGPLLANFSGSGTVALEAALMGIKSFATDVNPMALALSRLKTTPLNLSLKEIKKAYLQVVSNRIIVPTTISKSNLIYENNRWMNNDVRTVTKEICSGISLLKSEELQNLFSVALASIIVNFCNIDKRCTNHYVFKENQIFSRDFLEESLWNEISAYYKSILQLNQLSNYPTPSIMFGSTCNLPFDDNSMGIVFSHPPYGTTINYYSINRMPMAVLDSINFINPSNVTIDDCKKEDISSSTLEKFKSFTATWINEVYRVLKPGGIFVTIIGDSRDNGKLSHPFTDIISYGEDAGLITKELFIWVTNHKSGMHIKRKGNHIDHNYIIIMEKLK